MARTGLQAPAGKAAGLIVCMGELILTRGILALDPVSRAPGAVARVEALRNNAFEAELAGVAEYEVAGLVDVLVEVQCPIPLCVRAWRVRALAFLERRTA
jgi:hypothetical protein